MRQQGFTLVELMIVVVTIAILAAIVIPQALAARMRANESAAISMMRSVSTAQGQFHTAQRIDVDRDAQGEYGLMRELTGVAELRVAADGSGAGKILNPNVLSRGLGGIETGGWASSSGYRMRIWLQGTNQSAIGEGGLTGLAGGGSAISTDWAETTWCAYARPVGYSTTGNRTFFVNQTGEIMSKDDPAAELMVSPGAAFLAGGFIDGITGALAIGTVGRDGERWTAVR